MSRWLARLNARWGRPEYGVARVGVVLSILAALVVYSTLSTVGTGASAWIESNQTGKVAEAMRQLPDHWKKIADQRYERGEISGYERRLEYQRAEQLRPQAQQAAAQLQQLGDKNVNQFLKSGLAQAVVSLALNKAIGKLVGKVPVDRLPTVGERLARTVGTDVVWDVAKSGGKVVVGAQTATDITLAKVIDFFASPSYLVGKAFKDRARGLDRLRSQIGTSAENELMAAHMMSLISSLEKLKREDPDAYDKEVTRKARRLDNLMTLSEEQQRMGNRKVRSQWKTTLDFQNWLHAQVKAKQKADEEKTRVAQLTPSFEAYPPQGKAPLQVRFTAHVTGDVERFQWDFGDKFTGEGLIVAHIYKAAGEYEVTLTVTDAQGRKKSTTRKVTVVAGEGAATVKVGLSPSKAKPGDTITIYVNPQITGMPEGEVTVTVTVDGREVLKYSHTGSLEGDLSRSLRHPLPKDIQGGEHVVQANLTARAGPKAEPVAATGSRAFEVEGEAGTPDAFIGTWHGTGRGVVTGPAGTAASVPVTLTVEKAGENMIRVSVTSPDPSASARDDIYTVKGNVATLNKHYFDQGMEYFERATLTVVGEGKRIIGRGTTEVWFTSPKRERAVTGTSSLVAKKAE